MRVDVIMRLVSELKDADRADLFARLRAKYPDPPPDDPAIPLADSPPAANRSDQTGVYSLEQIAKRIRPS